MVAHYEVKNYETAKAYLAELGIEIEDEAFVTEYVESFYLHFQSPWLAFCSGQIELRQRARQEQMLARLGVKPTTRNRFSWQGVNAW